MDFREFLGNNVQKQGKDFFWYVGSDKIWPFNILFNDPNQELEKGKLRTREDKLNCISDRETLPFNGST